MTCPEHGEELETVTGAPVAGGVLLACPRRGCSYSRMPQRHRSAVQPKLPLDPGRAQRAVHVREEDLQRGIIDALRLQGFEVLQTTVRYKFSPCMHCGRMTRPAGGYGASPGVPDLLVWTPIPVEAWRGLECKGSETAVSAEQRRLADEGKVTIVRSLEEALEAVAGR